MKTILFVCTGNTCRSPMAQALLIKYIEEQQKHTVLPEYRVWSAGISTVEGLPPSQEAVMVLSGEGIDLSQHKSRQLSESLIRQADYILTMSAAQRDYLQQLFPDLDNIETTRQFALDQRGDIIDPFRRGLEAYQQCLQELKRLIPGVFDRIFIQEEVVMQVVIGSDHAGVALKKDIIEFLQNEGYDVLNCGTDSSESVDYPDIAQKVAGQVLQRNTLGIIICGTGIGISIAANKIAGIRAALCQDPYSARLAREHNNANILALGARVIGTGLALDIVQAFLNSEFQGGRHQRRVEKIHGLENTKERSY